MIREYVSTNKDFCEVYYDLGRFIEKTRELEQLMRQGIEVCRDNLPEGFVEPAMLWEVERCADDLRIAMNRAEKLQDSIYYRIC